METSDHLFESIHCVKIRIFRQLLLTTQIPSNTYLVCQHQTPNTVKYRQTLYGNYPSRCESARTHCVQHVPTSDSFILMFGLQKSHPCFLPKALQTFRYLIIYLYIHLLISWSAIFSLSMIGTFDCNIMQIFVCLRT